MGSDRIPHAYIFHGPDGVGKEMFALRLAKTLLCEKAVDLPASEIAGFDDWDGTLRDACGKCRSCHLADVENHPDLHLVYRQLNAHHPDALIRNRKALQMGVEVVRHFVIDSVGVSPACGKAKVFIIREADLITDQAQNALLKTLEEPPDTTFIILLANSLDRLLITTRSRCQVVGFVPLPTDFVAQKVRNRFSEIAEDEARLYAALAQGSLGKALQYATDDLSGFNSELASVITGINRGNASAAAGKILNFAKEKSALYRERNPELSDTAAQRQAMRVVFVLMATWFRDCLHTMAGMSDLIANSALIPLLQSACNRFSLETSSEAIGYVVTAERQLDLNTNTQLCVESLCFKLAAL